MIKKYIDLSNLPHNKTQVNWENSIGLSVKFIYDDVSGELTIINYKNKKIFIKYGEFTEWISTNNFKNCQIGIIIQKISKDGKLNIGEVYNNLKIINKTHISKVYKYKCIVCGYENEKLEYDIIKYGCSCCRGLTVVEGINDIPTTASWMVKYFQGGYDEAKLYTKSSHSFIYPICPNCGKVKDKKMKINNIYYHHSIGCICSDGISYPEKFIYSFLTQLNCNFEFQYKPNWSDRVYDFYLPEFNCIIEAHGEQHYNEKSTWNNKENNNFVNDIYKKKLAITNSVKQYIEIDCRYSDDEWIKNNIINSKLNEIINFKSESLDWYKCSEFAMSSLCKSICEAWNNSNHKDTLIISKMFKISRTAVIRYLHKGKKLGLCEYSVADIKRSVGLKMAGHNKRKVKIYKDEIFLGEYESMAELSRRSIDDFGIYLSQSKISIACKNQSLYKKFKFIAEEISC